MFLKGLYNLTLGGRYHDCIKKESFIFSIICDTLALIIFSSVKLVSVNAMSDGDYSKYKYYTSYEIQPGDTLTSIAEKYTANTQISICEYIDEVKKNNKLKSDRITSGKHIIIAYYSDEYKK